MREEILLLKIHNGLNDGKDYYEATRGNWRISENRLQSISFVAGINRGKVICLFKPIQWKIIEEGKEKGRKYFVGVEASRNLFVKLENLEEKLLKKFGRGNPVAYIDVDEINNNI